MPYNLCNLYTNCFGVQIREVFHHSLISKNISSSEHFHYVLFNFFVIFSHNFIFEAERKNISYSVSKVEAEALGERVHSKEFQ